ncbi:hypothetical protein NGB36_22265 [Streptomyces sp. RB6PN25]|uniref:Lipoprotein n=1 Tax=Streptomyces humicola TaxID=2953240 RepID=A0ABT1PZY9_9ACTN|nr:hypothetical protein [Streptomyces humicola]MCQ4083252.1 hypothetical protein [Streptomyces humicola]
MVAASEASEASDVAAERHGHERLRRAVSDWGGWVALAAGAVLCVLGWYGVSGQSLTERQLPYLASATIPGAALIVAGAVLLARDGTGSGTAAGAAESRVEELYRLLTQDEEPVPTSAAPASAHLVAVPGGTMLHRADCPLVAGKPEAAEAPADEERLRPCPVCEPPAPEPER